MTNSQLNFCTIFSNKSEFMAGWKKNINELVVKLNESACGGAEMSFSRPSPEFDCLALPTSNI